MMIRNVTFALVTGALGLGLVVQVGGSIRHHFAQARHDRALAISEVGSADELLNWLDDVHALNQRADASIASVVTPEAGPEAGAIQPALDRTASRKDVIDELGEPLRMDDAAGQWTYANHTVFFDGDSVRGWIEHDADHIAQALMRDALGPVGDPPALQEKNSGDGPRIILGKPGGGTRAARSSSRSRSAGRYSRPLDRLMGRGRAGDSHTRRFQKPSFIRSVLPQRSRYSPTRARRRSSIYR